MAECISGLSEAPAISNVTETSSPPEEPIETTFNEVNTLKPVENAKTANGDQKPPKNPRRPFFVFNHIAGFPHFISQRNPSHPDKIYASALFASGHGYPLYTPETVVTHLPADFRKIRGISIGDVGVLSNRNQFLFEFNIFLPTDHPYNKDHTPDSFIHLDPLNESEICTTADYFPRGSVVASKGIEVTRHSEDPLNITFRSSERRGAFMVLPEGATRHDISTTTTRVFDYIQDNAVNWARHFAQIRGQTTANGSLYVITGVDKTSVCSMLTFPFRPPTARMSARYQDGLLSPTEWMSNASNQGADPTLSPIPKSQCVFMRGIRVGLGRTEWTENVDDRPEADTPYTEIFFNAPRLPYLNIRIWGKDEQTPSLNDKSFFSMHAFHPSDIVAQIMLCLDPDDATAALVDDSVWSIASQAIYGKSEVRQDALTFSCSRGCSFNDFCLMLDDIFELHKLTKSGGVLKLVRNSKQMVVRDPWHRRFWFWLTNRQRIRGGTVFKELFRQGQFHFDTNDDIRSKSML